MQIKNCSTVIYKRTRNSSSEPRYTWKCKTARAGRKLIQREFVLGLIEEALEAAERQAQEGAGVSPCEAPEDEDDPQPPEDEDDPQPPEDK